MRRVLHIAAIVYFAAVTCALVLQHPALEIAMAEYDARRCVAKLRNLRSALVRFRQERGEFPDRPEPLYPRYVPNADDFLCPAADRIMRYRATGYAVQVGDTSTRSAYLLSYISFKRGLTHVKRGSDMPLLICPSHVELVSDKVFGHMYQGVAFRRRHGVPAFLVARLDGRIDRLPFGEMRRRKLRSSDEF
jgi:hypothetical protein